MFAEQDLLSSYPQTVRPDSATDIPKKVWLVYILTYNGKPIVVGHGKASRAKVIFDGRSQVTSGHLKALFVRMYRLFGSGLFQPYMIPCTSKEEAKRIEKSLHDTIGGNSRELPTEIEQSLFEGLVPGTLPHMVLRMALCSSFDGLADLRLWRRKGILSDEIWNPLSAKLALDEI